MLTRESSPPKLPTRTRLCPHLHLPNHNPRTFQRRLHQIPRFSVRPGGKQRYEHGHCPSPVPRSERLLLFLYIYCHGAIPANAVNEYDVYECYGRTGRWGCFEWEDCSVDEWVEGDEYGYYCCGSILSFGQLSSFFPCGFS